jgi:hypothetical protein
MATPHYRKPYSPAFVTHTHQVWQGYYDVPLTEEDAGSITNNLVEFFEILMEWDRGQDAL